MPISTPLFPTATVQDLDGLTILHCGRCGCRAVVIPKPNRGEDWHCPWCHGYQAVDWQTKGVLPVSPSPP